MAAFVNLCLACLVATSQEGGALDLGSIPRAAHAREDDGSLRVVLVGNTLVERAARHGTVEAALTRRWPERSITFRNLGWSGDTATGSARVGFGPSEANRSAWRRPDQEGRAKYAFGRLVKQVRDARPDVLIVGYGSEAAFGETAGFGKDLDRLLDELAKTGAKLVLLSPVRRERPRPELPDPTEPNKRLKEIRDIIRGAAEKREAVFIDLFGELKAAPGRRLTDNGIHLNAEGYRRMARLIERRLAGAAPPWSLHLTAGGDVVKTAGAKVGGAAAVPLGLRFDVTDRRLPLAGDRRVVRIDGLKPARYTLSADGNPLASATHEEWARGVTLAPGPEADQAEKLRATIVEKNRLFGFGFRPQNKAYILLFRRHERGDHAEEIRRFTVLARGKEREIARFRVPARQQYVLMREKAYPDHEVPRAVPKPDPAAELRAMRVAEGFRVNLFAADPMIANPIQATWDERGRMWVATSTTYPHLRPGDTPDDRIIILEDTDGDGRADLSTVFADGLLIPHSIALGDGGVYVTHCTEILFLKDTDGDDRADERRVILSGFGNADLHHAIHGFRRGPDGRLYFSQSIYINSYVETPWGRARLNASGIWRFDPRSLRLEVFARGLVNPWGHVFDRWGQSFATDGAGGGGLTYVIPGGAYNTAAGAQRTLPALNPGHPKNCGLEVISGRHFPESWRGTMVTGDFRANRINRFRPVEDGSGFASRREKDVIVSSHRSFRPVEMRMGPDGALYVMDWYSPVIDHGEVNFHHPARDHRHGRIWRLTAEGRPLVKPPRLLGAPVDELLEALKAPEDWTRAQARRLLRERGKEKVAPALRKWAAALDPSDPEFEHHRLEALWVSQAVDAVDAGLLQAVLRSGDGRARAAAVRIGGSRDQAIADDHPRVRLEAVHALRQEGLTRSVEVAMRALDRPVDRVLNYALWLAARETKEAWLADFKAGRVTFNGNAAHAGFALRAAEDPGGLAPLVTLLREGKVAGRDRAAVMKLVSEMGGPEELEVLFGMALEGDPVPLELLVGRKARPSGDPERIVRLVEGGSAAAARLAGAWNVEAARGAIEKLADRDPEAAADGLSLLGGEKSKRTLMSWTGTARRLAAARGLVRLDVRIAADRAAAALAEIGGDSDPSALVEAFLRRPEGAEALARSLEGRKLPPRVASIGARLADSSGRGLKTLVAAFRRAGSLGAPAVMPEGEALRKLIAEVAAGDAARGETVFRRADLACWKCHAIGGAGGNVGPDLAGIGAHSPPAYLLESILAPSRKLKEGYETTLVRLKDGTILTGTKAGQTGSHLLLRGSDGETRSIPVDRLAQTKGGTVSIMPTGLAAGLGRGELVDLVTFLSRLGREKRYTISPARLVRRWRVKGAPLYSTVSGELPLSEIAGAALFEVEVTTPGRVGFRFNDTTGLRLRVDAGAIDVSGEMAIALTRGVHAITLEVDRAARKAPLRVELVDVEGSSARASLVTGR